MSETDNQSRSEDHEKVGTLEIDQDMGFQQGAWWLQRMGWAVIVLIVLAALAGLLGPGPLSQTTLQAPDNTLAITFDRFTRYDAPTRLMVTLSDAAVEDGQAQVWVSQSYLQGIRLEEVVPEPERVETSGEWVIFTFNVGETPAHILFDMQTEQLWRLSGEIGAASGERIVFTQIVYP